MMSLNSLDLGYFRPTRSTMLWANVLLFMATFTTMVPLVFKGIIGIPIHSPLAGIFAFLGVVGGAALLCAYMTVTMLLSRQRKMRKVRMIAKHRGVHVPMYRSDAKRMLKQLTRKELKEIRKNRRALFEAIKQDRAAQRQDMQNSREEELDDYGWLLRRPMVTNSESSEGEALWSDLLDQRVSAPSLSATDDNESVSNTSLADSSDSFFEPHKPGDGVGWF